MRCADRRAMSTVAILESMPESPNAPTGKRALDLTQEEVLRISSRIQRGIGRVIPPTHTFGPPVGKGRSGAYVPTGGERRRKNPHRSKGG